VAGHRHRPATSTAKHGDRPPAPPTRRLADRAVNAVADCAVDAVTASAVDAVADCAANAVTAGGTVKRGGRPLAPSTRPARRRPPSDRRHCRVADSP